MVAADLQKAYTFNHSRKNRITNEILAWDHVSMYVLIVLAAKSV